MTNSNLGVAKVYTVTFRNEHLGIRRPAMMMTTSVSLPSPSAVGMMKKKGTNSGGKDERDGDLAGTEQLN